MEWLEQINYTIIEPKNDYRSDIYSPWQTKLQLEIWQEVNPEKVKKSTQNIELDTTQTQTKIIKIKTNSFNRTIVTHVTNLQDLKKNTWLMINQMRNQRCRTDWMWWWYDERMYRKWYLFKFDNCEWKIVRLYPWWFDLEIKWTKWVVLDYEAYNTPFRDTVKK